MIALPRLPGIERLSAAELRELVRASDAIGISPAEMAVVIWHESGFRTQAKNPSSTAVGLLQWTRARATELGVTVEDIRQMSAAEQLRLAERDLARFRSKLRQTGDLYVAVFAPAGLGQSDDYALAHEHTDQYELNKGLDLDRDGQITVRDLRARVLDTLATHPSTVVVPTLADEARGFAAPLLFGAAFLWLWWRSRPRGGAR